MSDDVLISNIWW